MARRKRKPSCLSYLLGIIIILIISTLGSAGKDRTEAISTVKAVATTTIAATERIVSTLVPTPSLTPSATVTPSPDGTIAAEAVEHDTPRPTKEEEMVWVASKGKKYHRKENCSNMKSPRSIPLSEAIAAGYAPCKKCR